MLHFHFVNTVYCTIEKDIGNSHKEKQIKQLNLTTLIECRVFSYKRSYNTGTNLFVETLTHKKLKGYNRVRARISTSPQLKFSHKLIERNIIG